MVSITLSVPEEIRNQMKQFPEMNWSGFVKKSIVHKVNELKEKEKIFKELKKEQETIEWAVKLQQASRKGRLDVLKKKGLI